MKRVPLFVVLSLILPIAAVAQVPPTPPQPPTPPTPAAAPVPPRPSLPTPWVMVPPVIDTFDMLAAREAAQAAAADARIAFDQARESMRVTMPEMRLNFPDVHFDFQDRPFMSGQSDSGNYSSGLSQMSNRKYEEAIVRFDRVIAAKAGHADGAMYHKAYCQAKLGKSEDAVATLADLRKTYPQSLYLKDARALEADVRKLGPNQVDDSDLKILAIQSMQGQDPDQVIPLLEGVLNKPTEPLQVKERALFVLATIDQPRAHQILLTYAKGGGNPDLQRKAISYLGSRAQKTTSAELIDIYNSSPDLDVRLAVISAFRSAGDKSSLMRIASGGGVSGGVAATARAGGGERVVSVEGTILLQSRAMSNLTDLASPQELWPLYQKEENKDLRSQWISVFSSMGAVDQLLQAAKTDKEPSVKLKAVRSLGNLKAEKTGTALADMYTSGDKETRSAVITALGSQENADSLVAIARKETDPELTRQIVSRLAEMARHSKVAMNYLMEIVKK